MTWGIATTSDDIVQARRRGTLRQFGRWRHRHLVGLTDRAIHRLEELNLADRGACPPDSGTADAIDEALQALPGRVRRCFPGRATVQQALDGMFAVQEALQRNRRGGPMRREWPAEAAGE